MRLRRDEGCAAESPPCRPQPDRGRRGVRGGGLGHRRASGRRSRGWGWLRSPSSWAWRRRGPRRRGDDRPPARARGVPAARRPPGRIDRDRHARADVALASADVGALHPSLWPGIDPESSERQPRPGRTPVARWVDRLATAIGGRRGDVGGLEAAVAAAAMAVAPVALATRPVSAQEVLNRTCVDCPPGSRCCGGYTAFCCTLPGGDNFGCPDGMYVGGWWQCNYGGTGLCGSTNFATTWTATRCRAQLSRRLPLRERRVRQLQDVLHPLPIRPVQHEDHERRHDHVPPGHVRHPVPDRLPRLQLLGGRRPIHVH